MTTTVVTGCDATCLWRMLATSALAAACGHPPVQPSTSSDIMCDVAPAAPDAWRRDARAAALAAHAEALAALPQEIGPVFSHDGRNIVFSSSRSGRPELYIAPRDNPAAARRLPGTENTVLGQQLTWDDRAVLFTADRDGDEHWRVLRADLETGDVVDLTPTPLNSQGFTLSEGAPDTVFCAGVDRGDGSTKIYALPATHPGAPRVLYSNAKLGWLTDVDRAARLGLFVQFDTYQQQQLLVVDLVSGTADVLYPRHGAAAIKDAVFAADGARVFVATDAGGEQATLLALDARTGDERARYVEPEAPHGQIDQVAAARRGHTLAFKLDAGDHAVVRVLDQETLLPGPPLALPLGVGHFGLADDGEQLLVSWSTPDMPASLFVATARSGGVQRLHDAPGRAMLSVVLDRVTSFDGLELPTVVIRPRGGDARVPVVVDLHGGPAASSAARWSVVNQLLASDGIAVVAPNVRGSGGFGRAFEAADDGRKRTAAFRDLDAVRAWIARQAWADATRMAVTGASFGGYLVLEQLTDRPDAWRAGVDEFSIADLTSFLATTTGAVRQNYLHELGDPVADASFLRSISPLGKAGHITTPLFVYAGANDPRVPCAQSDCIVSTLRQLKIPVEYMVAADEGHGYRKRTTQTELAARVVAFLERALGVASPPAP